MKLKQVTLTAAAVGALAFVGLAIYTALVVGWNGTTMLFSVVLGICAAGVTFAVLLITYYDPSAGDDGR